MPWSGSPQLPASYTDNFGVSLAGQFSVAENAAAPGSALGAWKLVCLQYNGVAQLLVDGMLVISPSQASPGGAGYAEVCRAVQLMEVCHVLAASFASLPPGPWVKMSSRLHGKDPSSNGIQLRSKLQAHHAMFSHLASALLD